jgi:hypothetical protein
VHSFLCIDCFVSVLLANGSVPDERLKSMARRHAHGDDLLLVTATQSYTDIACNWLRRLHAAGLCLVAASIPLAPNSDGVSPVSWGWPIFARRRTLPSCSRWPAHATTIKLASIKWSRTVDRTRGDIVARICANRTVDISAAMADSDSRALVGDMLARHRQRQLLASAARDDAAAAKQLTQGSNAIEETHASVFTAFRTQQQSLANKLK